MPHIDEKKPSAGEATSAHGRDDVLLLLRNMGEDLGSFDAIGGAHWAIYNEDGPTLVISFDRLEDMQALQPGTMPTIFGQATQNGWSHLSLISEGESWYRDPDVYAYLDQLVDDCFFDEFDRVVFVGTGMGAYAAAAFSVTTPGCTVLSIQPRATLDPQVAGWDTRDRKARRLNFNDRYGYAPEMTEGATRVFTIHDPYSRLDAMHASLFRKPWVTALKTPFLGDDVALNLTEMGILPKLIKSACDGKLTPHYFNQLWRERRNYGPYLRRILRACTYAHRPAREAMICRSVTQRLRAPVFRKHLEKLEKSENPEKA